MQKDELMLYRYLCPNLRKSEVLRIGGSSVGSGVWIFKKKVETLHCGKHAQFLNMLGTCQAIHHMSYFNVTSPLGMVFSILVSRSSSKVTWKVWGAMLDLFSASPFLSWGPWVSYLVLAGKLSSIWRVHTFLLSLFCQGICWENERRQEVGGIPLWQ